MKKSDISKLSERDKGIYLRKLMKETYMDVIQGSNLHNYLVSCCFTHEYAYCLTTGQSVTRFFAPNYKHE